MSDTKKPLRLLLTCCLGYYMHDTIACFKNNDLYDITVIGADMNAMEYNMNAIDVFYQVPRSDDPSYFDVIFDIAKKEHVDVVMPLHSKELIPFAEKREMFEALGMKLAVPPLDGLRIANDKIRSFEYMKENGFPVPATCITADTDTAHAFLAANKDKTFVTKLSDSCGARGFYRIEKEGEADDGWMGPRMKEAALDAFLRENGETLLQEYLPGKEYTVDMVLQDGKCVAYFTKECTNVQHGIIHTAVIKDRADVRDLCISFAESLGLCGNVGFDVKCDANDTPYITDGNPRITATIALGNKGGLNLPIIGLQVLLGEYSEKERVTAKEGIAIARQIGDFYFDAEGRCV